jgi:hypothetical protein
MKTFDYEQVNATLSPLKAKLQDCAHGEGNQCEMLDSHLNCCAEICFKVHGALVEWAQDVFAGRVVFDPEAERLWRAEVGQIYAQAKRVWKFGRKAEAPCWDLPGQSKLETALWHLNYLLENWVTPKLSVAPSPRVTPQLDATAVNSMRQQLAELPAFPKVATTGR